VIRPWDQADEELAEVQADWQAALKELLADWGPVAAAQKRSLVKQIRAAIDADDIEALAALSVDTGDAEDTLTLALQDLAASAAQQMADTAENQGVTVDPGVVDPDTLGTYSATAAGLLAAGLAIAAGQEALRRATPGRTGDEVADEVAAHLASLSDAYLTAQLGGALSAAQNQGRFATLVIAPVATYVASEANDGNTCDACEAEDGTEFATLDEAMSVYGCGGYPDCAGGPRCRGTVVAQWDQPQEES